VGSLICVLRAPIGAESVSLQVVAPKDGVALESAAKGLIAILDHEKFFEVSKQWL
jgi:hypothetical protein